MVNRRFTADWRPPQRSLPRAFHRASTLMIAAALIAGLAGLSWFLDRAVEEIAGRARVLDGDSLVVKGTEIRLYGIDAPEYRQTCERGGERWPCGVEAAQALRTMASGREVSCRAREQDRYGRTVAVCHAAGLDLGNAMVRGGYAIAYGAYERDEQEARRARRGIWSSSFEPPAAFRARHRGADRRP